MKNVFIGKDVIELVGNAMYLEPLTVYREYIQNSVDAIDEAIEHGILDNLTQSRIDIHVNSADRKIVIRDNGLGIPKSEFLDRMLSIGGSKKRRTTARGFRGVGRLAGLGFCQELVFRTRAKGDVVCQLKWDVRQIKTVLAQYSGDGDVGDLIKDVTEYAELPSENYPEHFFEVEMIKPIRVGGDTLMNFDRINSYVCQNAPVPFSRSFSLADDIRNHVQKYGSYNEYNVYINNADDFVVKPYEDTFNYSETKAGKIEGNIEPITIENLDGEITAAGWIAHHDYQGAIPLSAKIGGIRARIGNIQIGERNVFSDVFPEERFNSWTIGELYIFDKGLIPNGRRDGFEHNGHLINLKNKLLPYAHGISKQCREQSSLRNNRKRIELALNNAELIAGIIEQGSLSTASVNMKRSEAKGKLMEAEFLLSIAQYNEQELANLKEQVKTLHERLTLINNDMCGAGMQTLSKVEKDVFNKVFDLVYECSTNQATAKLLIDRIIARM